MSVDGVLKHRLFGYGTPYRVELSADGSVGAVDTTAEQEAQTLALLLDLLAGGDAESLESAAHWAYSMPFGRCGIEGLPREHIQVHFCAEAYLDVLNGDGVQTQVLSDGQIVAIEPRTIARVRARPLEGRRVLVAFQTQDHTPLHGNAGAFAGAGAVPDDWRQRLATCHAAFAAAAADGDHRRAVLEHFFAAMAQRLLDAEAIPALRVGAAAAGSYAQESEAPFFERQRELLGRSVIDRIARADEGVYRFPGMFGGVAPLFSLV